MPLTFGQAYAIVCPDGGEVLPNSRQYCDIMELMKQSGYVSLNDRMVKESVPKIPTTVQEAQVFMERRTVTEPTGLISKRQWLSVEANRQAFIKHLNKK